MTTPNPTPAERQREVARELSVKVVQAIFHLTPDVIPTGWPDEITPLLAAALAATRREALAEQMERDCKAVCNWCKNYPDTLNAHKTNHIVSGVVWTCMAQRIYAAAIEALRDKP